LDTEKFQFGNIGKISVKETPMGLFKNQSQDTKKIPNPSLPPLLSLVPQQPLYAYVSQEQAKSKVALGSLKILKEI
jgi:hypothetical protein